MGKLKDIKSVRFFCILSLVFSGNNNSYAQQVPSSAESGALQRQYELKPDIRIPKEVRIPRVLPSSKAPVDSEKLGIRVSAINIEGNTIFSDKELSTIYAKYIGKETSIKELYGIAAEITKMYQKNDYILSFAVVPAQRIKDGTFTIKVVEGFFDDLIFETDHHSYRSFFDDWKQKIASGKPVKGKDLEQMMFLMSNLYGAKVEPIIEASKTTQGASVLRIHITHDYTSGEFALDNYGTKYIGPIQQTGTLNINSALGLYEKITFRDLATVGENESRFGEISFNIPINSSGDTFGFSASKTKSYPGFILEDSEIVNRTKRQNFSYSHPLIFTANKNWFVGAEFDSYNSETTTLQTLTSEDKVRSLRFNSTYLNKSDDGNINYARIEFSQGLNILDATESNSPNLSRANGRSDFGKLKFHFLHSWFFKKNFIMTAKSSGQYAFTQLLSSEEFGLGGRDFGRGYGNSDFVGDHGLAGSLELSYYKKPESSKYIDNIRLYVFYDIGTVWKIDGDLIETDKVSAASGGIGVNTTFKGDIVTSIELAKPLTQKAPSRSDENGKNAVLLFSIKKYF